MSPDGLGYFSNGCYYKAASPPPPASDPVWGSTGHKPSDNGALYTRICLPLGFRSVTTVWLATPPAGPPPPPPAVTLAQRALAKLRFPTLTAASNASASRTTYVGVPTWLWVQGAWRPMSATAAVPTRSVTLTVTPMATTWDLQDGLPLQRCNGPGEPFNAADPNNPPCGYTYSKSTYYQPQEGPSPNDRFFHIRGHVIYGVHWVCKGSCDQNAGDLPDYSQPTTPLPLRVFEIQTVVTAGH